MTLKELLKVVIGYVRIIRTYPGQNRPYDELYKGYIAGILPEMLEQEVATVYLGEIDGCVFLTIRMK